MASQWLCIFLQQRVYLRTRKYRRPESYGPVQTPARLDDDLKPNSELLWSFHQRTIRDTKTWSANHLSGCYQARKLLHLLRSSSRIERPQEHTARSPYSRLSTQFPDDEPACPQVAQSMCPEMHRLTA